MLKRYKSIQLPNMVEAENGYWVEYHEVESQLLQAEELRKIDLQNCKKIDELQREVTNLRNGCESKDEQFIEVLEKLAIVKALLHKGCCPDDAVWMARKVIDNG